MRSPHLATALLLAALVLLAGPLSQADAQSVDTFAVEGQVRSGTAGATLPTDLQVRLVAVLRDAMAQSWDGTVELDGSYRFDGVTRIVGATYVLGADYGGATYIERVEPPGSSGVASKDLTVYESVNVDPGIRFDQSALVVSSIDEANRSVSMLEIHTITNPTDRTFVPRSDGPGGPTGLLVFPLPPNAFQLSTEFGIDSSLIVQIDRGFASLNPVYPGRTEMAFRYQFPYADNNIQLTRTVRYPLTSLQVLGPGAGPRVESAQLTPADAATIGGREYRRLGGGPFDPGSAITLMVSDLPLPGGPFARIPTGSLAVGGVCIGLAIILVGWWRGLRGRASAVAGLDAEEIVDELVALDVALAEHRIDPAEHRAVRERLLAAARQTTTLEHTASTAGP